MWVKGRQLKIGREFGQRLWLSGQSSCFWHQRPVVWIQSSANFYLWHLFTVNCFEKTKMKTNEAWNLQTYSEFSSWMQAGRWAEKSSNNISEPQVWCYFCQSNEGIPSLSNISTRILQFSFQVNPNLISFNDERVFQVNLNMLLNCGHYYMAYVVEHLSIRS